MTLLETFSDKNFVRAPPEGCKYRIHLSISPFLLPKEVRIPNLLSISPFTLFHPLLGGADSDIHLGKDLRGRGILNEKEYYYIYIYMTSFSYQTLSYAFIVFYSLFLYGGFKENSTL